MDWRDLLTAFALYLMLDGMLPFVSPSGFKRVMGNMSKMTDSTLRTIGVAGITAGVLLLHFVR